ncbi:MAG: hypothetical protein AAF569_07240 [Pseudomonadota bacterium]
MNDGSPIVGPKVATAVEAVFEPPKAPKSPKDWTVQIVLDPRKGPDISAVVQTMAVSPEDVSLARCERTGYNVLSVAVDSDINRLSSEISRGLTRALTCTRGVVDSGVYAPSQIPSPTALAQFAPKPKVA